MRLFVFVIILMIVCSGFYFVRLYKQADLSAGATSPMHWVLPDYTLTPGIVNPILTAKVICDLNFRTDKYRNVTAGMKNQVYARSCPFSKFQEFPN